MARAEYVEPRRARITLGEWSERWSATRTNVKPMMIEAYAASWRTLIAPQWERGPLDAIRHADVAECVADLIWRGLSASRVCQAHGLLSSMLSAAVKDQRLPRLLEPEDRYLTHDEVDALTDSFGGHAALRSDTWQLRTSLGRSRRSASWPLQAPARTAPRRSSRDRRYGRLSFGKPKTPASREVSVPKFLHDELVAACVDEGPNDFILTAARGGPLRIGSRKLPRWFRSAAQGIEHRFPNRASQA